MPHHVSTCPSSWNSERDGFTGFQQSWFLDVPLGGEILESSRAVLPGQVLVELVLQGVQTVAVARAGAELGDVEAGSVRHVDHESVGEDHQVVLLEKQKNKQAQTNEHENDEN